MYILELRNIDVEQASSLFFLCNGGKERIARIYARIERTRDKRAESKFGLTFPRVFLLRFWRVARAAGA